MPKPGEIITVLWPVKHKKYGSVVQLWTKFSDGFMFENADGDEYEIGDFSVGDRVKLIAGDNRCAFTHTLEQVDFDL